MGNMLDVRTPQNDFRSTANIAVAVAGILAITQEVFLHRYFGHRYLGGRAAAALIVIPVFGALCFPHHNQEPLMWFMGVYVIAWLCARGEALRLRRKGVVMLHSTYNGWPRALNLSAGPDQEQRVKSFGEPILVAMVGALTYGAFDQPLGSYLLLSSFSLALTNGIYRIRTERQDDDMRDAMIQQEMMADRFRDVRGG